MNSLVIITVNWNSAKFTQAFCRDLDQFQDPPLCIIINNDPKESEEIKKLSGEKKVILETGANKGYSGGVNEGLRYAMKNTESEYFLVINNDVSFEKNFFNTLLKDSDQKEIRSPAILYMNTNYIQNTGGKISLLLGGTRNINKNQPYKNMKKELPDFLSGCCFLLSRKVIEEVGYFDEDYHSYYEDVDFSIRAKRKGYILSIIPEAKLWHYHSASTESVPEYKIRMISRNSILFARKQLPFFPRVLFITCSILRGILQNLSQKKRIPFWRGVQEGLFFHLPQ